MLKSAENFSLRKFINELIVLQLICTCEVVIIIKTKLETTARTNAMPL